MMNWYILHRIFQILEDSREKLVQCPPSNECIEFYKLIKHSQMAGICQKYDMSFCEGWSKCST